MCGKRKWEIHQLLSDNVPARARSIAHPTTGTYNSQFNLLSMSRVCALSTDFFFYTDDGRLISTDSHHIAILRILYFSFVIVCGSGGGRARTFPFANFRYDVSRNEFIRIWLHFYTFSSHFCPLSLSSPRRVCVWEKFFGFRCGSVSQPLLHRNSSCFDLFDFPFGYSPDGIEFPLTGTEVVSQIFFSHSILVLLFIDIVLSKSFFFFIAAVASSAFLLYRNGCAFFVCRIPVYRRCRRYGCGQSKCILGAASHAQSIQQNWKE